MTQAELDAIPIHELFGRQFLREENGIRVYVPVYQPLDCCYIKETDPLCTWDGEGNCWMFGKKDGVLMKYRNPILDGW